MGAAAGLLNLPDERLLPHVIEGATLEADAGHISVPGSRDDLGAAETAVAEIERRLTADPFHAPGGRGLARLRLGSRELAAAERAGRLLRLRTGWCCCPQRRPLPCVRWPGWTSRLPPARPGRRWIRPAGWLFRSWNTWIPGAGPGAWTRATAPWCADPLRPGYGLVPPLGVPPPWAPSWEPLWEPGAVG